MNVLSRSSNLCLGLIGLRGQYHVRCRLQFDRKFFSASQLRGRRDDDWHFSEDDDKDDARSRVPGPGESLSTNEVEPNKEHNGILGENNFDRGLFESNDSFESSAKTGIGDKRLDPGNIKSLRHKNFGIHTVPPQDINLRGHEEISETKRTGVNVMKNGSGDTEKGKFDNWILDTSASIPYGHPFFRKYVYSPNLIGGGGFYFVEGILFMKLAINASVRPEKVFYCDERQIKGLPLDPEQVEFYHVSKKWMTRVFKRETMFGEYDKEAILKAARRWTKMPVTVVAHSHQNINHLRSVITIAANFRCQELVITHGSLCKGQQLAVRRSEEVLLVLPVLDQVEWSHIEADIDSSTEIYLVCPQDKTDGAAGRSAGRRTEGRPVRVADVLSTEFWRGKNIMLIVSWVRAAEDEKLYKFCKKWNVKELTLSLIDGSKPHFVLPGFLGEITRQFYNKFPHLHDEFYKRDYSDHIMSSIAGKDYDDDDDDDGHSDLDIRRDWGIGPEEEEEEREGVKFGDDYSEVMEALLRAGRQKNTR